MFDFTQEISLTPKSRKLYKKLQLALYLAAFFLALYLGYLVVFPHKNFTFLFSNPSNNDNNIYDPRVEGTGFPEKGILPAGGNLLFDTNITSDYSQANVSITLNEENKSLENITLKRSYRAFMYDEGEPLGFRNGALLQNQNDFYIVSNGNLRRFAGNEILENLGYSPASFVSITGEDLKYNSKGPDITENIYPDDTLFRIEDDYYILRNQLLEKFVSEQAYLSLYAPNQAVQKDNAFLARFPLSQDQTGFADGALVSNGESVYVLSQSKFFPIDSVLTFEGKGYAWEDVTPVGTDELSIYEKEKIFTVKTPHPDGTILKTTENGKYYLIEGNQKRLLPTEAIAASWNKKNPVAVSEEALRITADCAFQKKLFSSRTYECSVPLERLSGLIGFNYEFSLAAQDETKIDFISVDYKKNINKNNFKAFLTNIYYAIRTNYAFSQNQ